MKSSVKAIIYTVLTLVVAVGVCTAAYFFIVKTSWGIYVILAVLIAALIYCIYNIWKTYFTEIKI